ncbi:MAG TPA: DNA-3-methyladenine glycosylase 2 family protein [Caulobacteraceae bacterium]|jgi:DNA-3-methyladenine glycosylase II|nr:DNA-3-methyladenine glycosylase 2 family protein [Caulobacteraceae bacterium]
MGPTDTEILAARRELAKGDPLLAKADALVPQTSWRVREGGFEALVHQIVAQQVSIASAAAIWARFKAGLGGKLTPEGVLAADDAQMRAFGLSRQKIRYARAIAEAAPLFAELPGLPDDEAVARLTAITGVGRWTAETYLLFCEGRLDFFPAGDVALQEGYRLLEGSDARAGEKALYAVAEAWRPYRGVAALLLWGYYGLMRKRTTEATAEDQVEVRTLEAELARRRGI